MALANLLPVQAETDDLDSFMYQTVGHQVIAAYAECMGLPLYRRRITGASHEQRLVYEDTTGDEVEDLYCLLAWVKERHPGVQAVASGAIASDYQRTRVERVCARLGLVSLAFLWHQPQGTLLARMIDASVEAILVKVAAAGLTPWRHLGAPLAVLPANLAALRRRYGINICGEGGEYETLTLDCPLFTRGRILLDGWETVVVSEDSLAPVALLHPTAFHVEPKQQQQERQQVAHGSSSGVGSGGGGFEKALAVEQAAGTQGRVVEVPDDFHPAEAGSPPAAPTAGVTPAAEAAGNIDAQLHVTEGIQFLTLTAEVPAPSGDPSSCCTTVDAAAALIAALQLIQQSLPGLGLTWRHSLFVHLYVPSMAAFVAANAAYSLFFPAVNPPSRATVELSANPELALVVEVLFARCVLSLCAGLQALNRWEHQALLAGCCRSPWPTAAARLVAPAARGDGPKPRNLHLPVSRRTLLPLTNHPSRRAPELRRVLHVQSISEWAPSCIGPYSQALQHAGLVSFAGQIGLHPPTMEVLSGGLEAQCVRCLASCQAVAVAMRTDLPRSILWCTVYCSEAAGPTGWQQAQAHLAAFLLGQLDTSLLLQPASRLEQGAGGGNSRQQRAAAEQEQRQALGQPGRQGSGVAGASGGGSSSEGEGSDLDEEPEQELDDYLRPPAMRRHWQPLLTLVTVPQLPRG